MSYSILNAQRPHQSKIQRKSKLHNKVLHYRIVRQKLRWKIAQLECHMTECMTRNMKGEITQWMCHIA